jgi:hypothetical protein
MVYQEQGSWQSSGGIDVKIDRKAVEITNHVLDYVNAMWRKNLFL